MRRKHPRLARVADAFLPLALMTAATLNPRDHLSLKLYGAMTAVSALSLFAGRAVRIAFAAQPTVRLVRGSVKCAILLTFIGSILLFGLTRLLTDVDTAALPVIAAGGLLNIEHIFYEYMYAIGDCHSARLSRGLTSLFVLVGLVIDGDDSRTLCLAGTAGLSALVALVVGLVMGDGIRGRPNAAVIRSAPRAALQTLLYPAAALSASLLLRVPPRGAAFFAGLTLCELCRTPFRRSPAEAVRFNRALAIVIAAAALLWLALNWRIGSHSIPEMLPWRLPEEAISSICAMLITAALCSLVLFGNLRGTHQASSFPDKRSLRAPRRLPDRTQKMHR